MPGAVNLDTTPQRDASIDVARGIAIILVVLGHNRAFNGAWPALVAAIFLFHVPLFFLVSGRVLRPEHPMRAAPKLAARLLLPFALAALLVGAAKCLTRGEFPIETLFGILWATGQTLPWSHLWFLPTLFFALLATHVLATGVTQSSTRWLVAIGLAVVASASLPLSTGTLAGTAFPAPVGLPWSVDLLPLCLLFVWTGQWLRSSPSAQRTVFHPLILGVAVVAFAVTAGTAEVDFNLRVFTPFAAALTAALAGCVVAMNAAHWLSQVALLARPLTLIGRHTLFIFLFHVSLQKLLLGAYPGEPLSGTALGALGLLSATATIALLLLVSVALDQLRARFDGSLGATPSGAQ